MTASRAVVLTLLTVACASAGTDGTAYRDYQYRAVQFHRVAAIAEGGDGQYRARFETLLVADLRAEHVSAVEGRSILPTTREISEAEMAQVLTAAAVDAALFLRTGEMGTDKTVVGDWSGVSTQVSPWVRFEAELRDVASGETAWRASATTSGNTYANVDTLLSSFCDAVTESLVKEGVVSRHP